MGKKLPLRECMTKVKTRVRIAPDGELTARAAGLPPGEHDAEIVLLDAPPLASQLDPNELLEKVRAIQAEVARLPVLDNRNPDEIIGYNERGHFD
jgi:hypothetical protein